MNFPRGNDDDWPIGWRSKPAAGADFLMFRPRVLLLLFLIGFLGPRSIRSSPGPFSNISCPKSPYEIVYVAEGDGLHSSLSKSGGSPRTKAPSPPSPRTDDSLAHIKMFADENELDTTFIREFVSINTALNDDEGSGHLRYEYTRAGLNVAFGEGSLIQVDTRSGLATIISMGDHRYGFYLYTIDERNAFRLKRHLFKSDFLKTTPVNREIVLIITPPGTSKDDLRTTSIIPMTNRDQFMDIAVMVQKYFHNKPAFMLRIANTGLTKGDNELDEEALRIIEKYMTYPRSCTVPKTPGADRRRSKGTTLKIANFNVEWASIFGDLYRRPGIDCKWKRQGQAWNHLLDLRDMILANLMDNDIIHFTEVEDCRVLETIKELLGKDHGYEPYLIVDYTGSQEQNVGFLSRLDPITAVTSIQGIKAFPLSEQDYSNGKMDLEAFSRNYLAQFRIDMGGVFVDLLISGVHFCAGASDPNRSARREIQATIIENHINAWSILHPEGAVIIVGDMNDFAKNVDSPYVMPILEGCASGMSDAMEQAFGRNRGSHISGSLLDHILISKDRFEVTSSKIIYKPTFTRNSLLSMHYPTTTTLKWLSPSFPRERRETTTR